MHFRLHFYKARFLDKNYSFYKAYYNLGCIFAKKKSYLLASNNFELAIKYNKNFASAYYNLACCQIKLKNYEQAKKNLIKAIDLEPENRDFYYNLAYCYKQLNKIKQAKKILETYEKIIKFLLIPFNIYILIFWLIRLYVLYNLIKRSIK